MYTADSYPAAFLRLGVQEKSGITGDHSKQDLRYTQKLYIYLFLLNNIWSYLLWSPVTAYSGPHLRVNAGSQSLPVPPLHRDAEMELLSRCFRQKLPQVAVKPDEAAPQRPQHGLAA